MIRDVDSKWQIRLIRCQMCNTCISGTPTEQVSIEGIKHCGSNIERRYTCELTRLLIVGNVEAKCKCASIGPSPVLEDHQVNKKLITLTYKTR